MKVGYIGLSGLGGRLASRLQHHYALSVYDASDAAVQHLVDQGAKACSDAGEVAATCEVIMLFLPSSDHLRSVLFGQHGIAQAAKPRTLIVDQTNGDPTVTRAMAAELAERGLELIDAPVSGTSQDAEAGTIAIMVGAAPAQFETIGPMLQAISTNVYHAGDLGAGLVVRLANNMLAGVHRAASLEALALAVNNGLDPERAVDVILASSGRNYYLETSARSDVLTGRLTSGHTLGLVHEDVALGCRLGVGSGVPMLIANQASAFYQVCINEMGGETEVDAAALVMDRLAGSHVVPTDHTRR
jgi:3-hydroxyisobutyrate dehydrogenase